jgi:para-aminobenzoate synthetase component 1
MKFLDAGRLFAEMNELGKSGEPFVFLTDAFAEKGVIEPLSQPSGSIWYKTPRNINIPVEKSCSPLTVWDVSPVFPEIYQNGFRMVMDHILRGDTFLLNYTQPTRIQTNLSLEELFLISKARYRVHLPGVFTCFSPETFVTIGENGIISSHPMKGTADATDPDAEIQLMEDSKEIAEHHTIVDLIRNDLSRVADGVTVERFRYPERLHTNRRDLIQISSAITGKLKVGWKGRLGDIFRELLPAGSVTGAPKPKTVEIIRKVENYDRGWYTGVFGVFDGETVDSAVLIRFIEDSGNGLVFKSGGGITFQSDPRSEYEEMIKKVYVPVA